MNQRKEQDKVSIRMKITKIRAEINIIDTKTWEKELVL